MTGSGRLHAFATRAYDLLDGEHLVMSIGAAHYAAWWLTAAGGMLYLTNKRLIFAPSLLTLWRPALAWGLSEIEGLGRGRPWFVALGTLWLIKPWYVQVGNRRFYFHTSRVDDWLNALSEATGLPTGAGDGS